MGDPCRVFVCAAVSSLSSLIRSDWARLARGKTPEGEEPPWSARNFVPYWSQVISSAAQRAAAAEILSRVREEVATRNAMSMRGA